MVLIKGVDEVCFEYVPSLSGCSDASRASLVWIGDAEDRPTYVGQATKVQINAKMDAALWDFVKTKYMDEKMFRALVSKIWHQFLV